MEVKDVFFRNVNKTFDIRFAMNCLVRNVVYAIFCKKCGKSYIGETINFRDRMNAHRSAINMGTNASMEISRHIYNCGEGFTACPILKVKEECKILRLVKEDKLIKLYKPDLNKDQRNILGLNLSIGGQLVLSNQTEFMSNIH